jgi:hypothetical protein
MRFHSEFLSGQEESSDYDTSFTQFSALSASESLICIQALCSLSVEVYAYVLLENMLFFGSVHVEKILGYSA